VAAYLQPSAQWRWQTMFLGWVAGLSWAIRTMSFKYQGSVFWLQLNASCHFCAQKQVTIVLMPTSWSGFQRTEKFWTAPVVYFLKYSKQLPMYRFLESHAQEEMKTEKKLTIRNLICLHSLIWSVQSVYMNFFCIAGEIDMAMNSWDSLNRTRRYIHVKRGLKNSED
jgi:hypothetical protein